MNLRCPICRRSVWLTTKGLAEHLADDHSPTVVAEELAALIARPATPGIPQPHNVQCRKVRYSTEHEARTELVGTVLSRNRGKKNRLECRVYECDRCLGWHLTSQERPPERNAG